METPMGLEVAAMNKRKKLQGEENKAPSQHAQEGKEEWKQVAGMEMEERW